jgi:hemoglobin
MGADQSVALMTGIYHGRPMPLHMTLPIDAEHFDRWLALWERTARELCPPAAADHFVAKAKLIAQSLELGVAMHHGAMLTPGERFRRAP